MNDDNDLDGFADLTTNFLALLIIVVMLLQTTSVAHRQEVPALRPSTEAGRQNYVTPLRDHRAPFTEFYYVAGDHAVRIDWSVVAEQIQQGAIRLSGKTKRVRLLGNGAPEAGITPKITPSPDGSKEVVRRAEQDLNAFSLTINFPDAGALRASSVPAVTDPTRWTADAVAHVQERKQTLAFIVADSGFELFSQIFDTLEAKQVCFRWYPYTGNSPFLLANVRQNYKYRTNWRCRRPE